MRRAKGQACVDCGGDLPRYHTTRCAACGDFYRRARRADGAPFTKVYPTTCTVCASPFIGRRRNAAYCSDDCERQSPPRRRSERRKGLARIGATPDQYWFQYFRQSGLCAICARPPGRRALAFDHDHVSGDLRSLLCHHCNTGLGAFRDDPELLHEAASYLRRHRDPRAVTGPDGTSTTRERARA